MRALALFFAMERNLPAILNTDVQYSIRNGNLDYNEDYGISVYISDITPTRTRLSGEKYEGHSASIQFLCQAGLTFESVIKTREFIQNIEEWLAELQNKNIQTTNSIELLPNGQLHYVPDEDHRFVEGADGIDIAISNTALYSSTVQLGKTENGRELFSLNAAISYYILGNHIDTEATTDDESAVDSESND